MPNTPRWISVPADNIRHRDWTVCFADKRLASGCLLFLDVTLRSVVTDVSGESIGPKVISGPTDRGELSYLAPLGSENISAPYFKQCFFQGGGITPQTESKHHASQSQDRNNKYFILYFEFCINNKI